MILLNEKQIFNVFDIFLIFIMMLLAFGNIGGAFSPVRIFAISISYYAIRDLRLNFITKNFKNALLFLLVFFLYANLSLLWSNDSFSGFKEAFYHLLHIVIFIELVVLSKKSKQPLNSICIGWLVAVLITLPIAFQEIVFDEHLSLTVHETDKVSNFGEGVFLQRIYASATFGNLNGYVTFLGLSLPFLCANILLSQTFKNTLVTFFALLSACSVVLINASRGGIITILVVVSVMFYFYLKTERPHKYETFSLFFLVIVIFLVYENEFLFNQFQLRLKSASLFEDSERISTLSGAIDLLHSSFFMGTGIGSIVESYKFLGLSDIYIPHNFLIEFAVQYGLLLVILLILFFANIFYIGKSSSNYIVRFLTYACFASLPFIGVVNSGYWLSTIFWCYISSLFAIVDSVHQS